MPAGCTSSPRVSGPPLPSSGLAPSTRRQPSASTTSGARTSRGRCARHPRRALHERALEARVALRPEQLAQLRVVERRPAPREPDPLRSVRGREAHEGKLLTDRALEPERSQPWQRRRTGRGRMLPDLVAIDDEHVRSGSRQLACDREPGEARAADQDVGSTSAISWSGRRLTGAPSIARDRESGDGSGGRARRIRSARSDRGRPCTRPAPARCRARPTESRRRAREWSPRTGRARAAPLRRSAVEARASRYPAPRSSSTTPRRSRSSTGR